MIAALSAARLGSSVYVVGSNVPAVAVPHAATIVCHTGTGLQDMGPRDFRRRSTHRKVSVATTAKFTAVVPETFDTKRSSRPIRLGTHTCLIFIDAPRSDSDNFVSDTVASLCVALPGPAPADETESTTSIPIRRRLHNIL